MNCFEKQFSRSKKRNPIKLPSLILSDMLRNSLGQAMHLWRDPKFDNVFNLLLPSKKQILSRAIDLQRIQLVLMFWEITTGHATNEQAKSIFLLSNIGVHKGRGGMYIATPNLFFLHTSFHPFGPKTPPFCVKQLLEQYTKKLSFYHTDQYAVTFRNASV